MGTGTEGWLVTFYTQSGSREPCYTWLFIPDLSPRNGVVSHSASFCLGESNPDTPPETHSEICLHSDFRACRVDSRY